MKVGIYARVSTDKQELENQLLQLREYCKKLEYSIYQEYTDIISGKETKRTGFDNLFKDAHKRKFDLVLFWDISRFSRAGTLYTLQKLKELDNLNIKWHSYNDSFISSMGQFKDVVLSILSTVARIEREKISERTKAGLERAKQYGKFAGRPKKDPNVYTHYCKYPKCRIKIRMTEKLCVKHLRRNNELKKWGV